MTNATAAEHVVPPDAPGDAPARPPAPVHGADVRAVSPAEARAMANRGEAVIVDVREPDERRSARIPGSVPMPLSTFDPADAAALGRTPVFHCASGVRSEQAARAWLAHPASGAEALHVAGGLRDWTDAGLPTESTTGKRTLPIMRQVQLIAGLLALVGTLLGVFVSPWLLVIPAFVGAGLSLAGATGFCGMAIVLGRMPWNRTAAACPTAAGGS